MVCGPLLSPPQVSTFSARLSHPGVPSGLQGVLELDHLAYLGKVLESQGVSPSAVEDLVRAHRPSTRRQSEWRKFQRFLRSQHITSIIPQVLLDFASSVFRSGNGVSAATVNNTMVAVQDPVKFGFGIEVDPRKWELLKASFFLQRPSRVPSPPSWSLPRVLDFLQSARFGAAASPSDLLLRALFLVALATGLRVS